MKKEPLNLLVRTRDKIIYQGVVKSLTSVNESGKFDILPNHANFISLIKKYIFVNELDDKTLGIEVDNGILKVEKNRIEVYLGVKQALRSVT